MGDELVGMISESDVRRLIEEALKRYGLIGEPQDGVIPGLDADEVDPRLPACPHAKILALYHEKLQELPRCLVNGDGRQAKTRAFWKWVLTSKKSDGNRRASTPEAALEWIGQYFARANRNDVVMGRIKTSGEHTNWVANFDYLISPRGRVQVIERTRERS